MKKTLIGVVLILTIVLQVSCSHNRIDDPGDWSFYTRIDDNFLFITLNFRGAGDMVMKVAVDSADASGSFEVSKEPDLQDLRNNPRLIAVAAIAGEALPLSRH